MVKRILISLAVIVGMLAATITSLVLLGSQGPICGFYDTYNDQLTGLIYENDGITDPEKLQEIRFFAMPDTIGAPCDEERHYLHLLHAATTTEELGMWLDAVKERNWVDCPLDEGRRLRTALGMEFVMRDGRMTFYEIWVYERDLMMIPLEESRWSHNSWGACTSTMFPLLERTGILKLLRDHDSGAPN